MATMMATRAFPRSSRIGDMTDKLTCNSGIRRLAEALVIKLAINKCRKNARSQDALHVRTLVRTVD